MKWEEARKICSVVALGIVFSGCVFGKFAKLNPQKPLGESAAASSTKGYLYGSFELDRDFLNRTNLFLRVGDDNGRTFEIPFQTTERPTRAIEVEAGTYRIREFLFTPGGPTSMILEREIGKIPLPSDAGSLSQPVRVEAGKGYYLGDFKATSRRTGFGAGPGFYTADFRGSVVGISQNFDSTTQAFKERYPSLRSLELLPAYTKKEE